MSDHDNPLERVVELLVYAPIGLAMFAKDTVPTFMKMFVARGQTEVTQRRKTAETQAGQYKTIGQMAVKYGGPEVRRQAEAAAGTVRKRAEETLAGITAVSAPLAAPATMTTQPSARPSTRSNGTAAKSSSAATTKPAKSMTVEAATHESAALTVDDLAIPEYDLLSASQVIDRLEGLTQPDLLALERYETTHRARTTILGKIAQLRA